MSSICHELTPEVEAKLFSSHPTSCTVKTKRHVSMEEKHVLETVGVFGKY